jgi:hypothetical protein
MRMMLVAVAVCFALQATSARAESGRQVIVESHTDSESYMWTLTKDTFFGGLAGGLLGGAVLLITGFEADPMLVAYCAGGGMVAGAGFGVWEIIDRRNQVSGPVALRDDARRVTLVTWTFRF